VIWHTLRKTSTSRTPDDESMPANIGLYSYGAAALAYILLTALLLVTQKGRALGRPLLVASVLTAVWAAVIAGSMLTTYPNIHAMRTVEVLRNAGWCFLLLTLLGIRLQGSGHILASRRWVPWFIGGFAAVLLMQLASTVLPQSITPPEGTYQNLAFGTSLAMDILGLLLLEQLYRNSSSSERWVLKHLCIGLGMLFAYDFFMYAEALLFQQLDRNLWQSRGLVIAFVSIFLAIAAGRIARSENERGIYLSRHIVFHTVTLLAAGIYLLVMAIVGYFIRYLGGTWGGVLQVTFLFAAGLVLLALLFSGQVRARTRVWLSKNFFSYKYDYRVEWLRFTETLASGGGDVPENIVKALAQVTASPGGLLWSRTDQDTFELSCAWELRQPDTDSNLGTLPEWLANNEWIIDLREWRQTPDLYDELDIPPFLEEVPRARLIIPLMFGESLQGIVLLRESDLHTSLNWEDRDLLKVAGRQAASHLAQFQASRALMASRQFEAFNRLSAYVVHDLKNILAQQSLIVSNAEKHRHNPVFIDDVIDTVRNSVARMTRLMDQMRSGVRGILTENIPVDRVLQKVVENRKAVPPAPSLSLPDDEIQVEADEEQLANVFNHLIQNAQEATTKNGRVEVRLRREGGNAVVEIEDDGVGMEEAFVRNRLFQPFDSTKGLAGMGVGAFESREFVRNLGGNIQVQSSPGEGSIFRVILPLASGSVAEAILEKEAISE
jgi:putative PEP-CTERM system histidine kinase